MNKWLSRIQWSPMQRQSMVISSTACFASIMILALFSILVLIVWRGAVYFWPQTIYQVTYQTAQQPTTVFAQISSQLTPQQEKIWRLRYSDDLTPFNGQSLIDDQFMLSRLRAEDAAEIQLNDGRVMFALPQVLIEGQNKQYPISDYALNVERVAMMESEIETLRAQRLAPIHEALAELNERNVALDAPARLRLEQDFAQYNQAVIELEAARDQIVLVVRFADGAEQGVLVSDIAQLTYPGKMGLGQKWLQVAKGIVTFLSDSPKQANTAGGVFPALFGTVLMVFLMTIIVSPFGVLAAVYLNEYAPDNALTSMIRVSVSNMAGVPSIVYGVFGLGFLVYTVGGQLDRLFFSDTLPAPTLGSPGLLWASVTMAMLTLPVVIVATEEGLRRVPRGLRSGSYALGATKAETIWYTVLPIASPGIMTGIILAIARAAGEVAPLMLVGAVKFAPNFPVDGEFPYLHLDRQFMHLGVLIYDGAFHSQTDAKSSSMMFATCLLLLLVVLVLNIVAIVMRTRLRKRYLQG